MSGAGTPEKGELLYEGKAKRVYATSVPGELILEYKDDATAFNAQKRGTIRKKGIYNNRIAAHFFAYLAEAGVESHFIRRISEREALVKAVEIVPLEVVVRNVVAGSLAKRLGLEEGTPLSAPVIEFYYKDDALGDPLVNRSHIRALGIAAGEELDAMEAVALRVNDLLRPYLGSKGLDLVDFKVEFGRRDGRILLADEISPDTCRFWDKATKEKLDKDRFRRDLGGIEEAYREVLRRLEGGDGLMTYEAKVYVTLKDGVLDPQGKAVAQGLRSMGYSGVGDVRIGRFIVLEIDAATRSDAERRVEEMCRRLLANPVIEDFRFELAEEG